MFIKILLLSIVTGIVGINTPFNVDKTVKYDEVVTTESFKQRNYQHSEWLSSYTEVIYKYESNEVASINDLVDSNIYLFSPNQNYSIDHYHFYSIKDISNFSVSVEELYNVDYLYFYISNTYVYIYAHNNNLNTNSQVLLLGNNQYNETDFYNSTFYITYKNNNQTIDYSCFSYTDYNEILSVTYHQPSTIIGYLNEFLETNLLNEIPFIRDINFNIGGQQINLLTWVVMLIGFVVVGLLILAFIKLIIWLVKLFSNSFLLR